MEQIEILYKLVACSVVVCVGYSVGSLIAWVVSLFGGICIGC